MTVRQELDDLLTAVVDRHVAANPALAADFGAVFDADASDTAAQWLTYYLTQYAGDIEALTATTDEPESASETAAPPDPAAAELLADVRAIVDDAVAAVPEAELLSSDEIDRILMEVLGEDVG